MAVVALDVTAVGVAAVAATTVLRTTRMGYFNFLIFIPLHLALPLQ